MQERLLNETGDFSVSDFSVSFSVIPDKPTRPALYPLPA
jgi:hypothetical protein